MDDLKINKTKDYSIFKFIEGNRKLIPGHLAKLTVSVNNKNLLMYNPIVVNENMEVIDGQHRLEVAKNNDLPIYYFIAKDLGLHEIRLLNQNNKNWSALDFVKSFAIKGNQNYIWFLKFMEEYGLNLTKAAEIIGHWGVGGSNYYLQIKNGKFVVTEAQRKDATVKADIWYDMMPFSTNKTRISREMPVLINELFTANKGKKFIEILRQDNKMYKLSGSLNDVRHELRHVLDRI